MESDKNNELKAWLAILLGVLAFVVLKSLFENDESKIVSKKGKKYLSDDNKMDEINDIIDSTESSNNHKEIVI